MEKQKHGKIVIELPEGGYWADFNAERISKKFLWLWELSHHWRIKIKFETPIAIANTTEIHKGHVAILPPHEYIEDYEFTLDEFSETKIDEIISFKIMKQRQAKGESPFGPIMAHHFKLSKEQEAQIFKNWFFGQRMIAPMHLD